jgi:hypothetical protein
VITEKRSRGVRYQMKNRVFQAALTQTAVKRTRKKSQSAEATPDATTTRNGIRFPIKRRLGHIWRHGQKPKWKGPKEE